MGLAIPIRVEKVYLLSPSLVTGRDTNCEEHNSCCDAGHIFSRVEGSFEMSPTAVF